MISVKTNATTLPQKIIAGLIGATVLILALMFSLVMIPVIIGVGMIGFGYFYWKTRALRKAMAQAAEQHAVIEGEAVVIREETTIRQLP
jgi:hypothetical protein